jgi:shikimate kinase
MCANATRQALQIIAAFENGNNAAFAMGLRNFHELQSGPSEIFFHQFQTAQRIANVCIEACADDNEIGLKAVEVG